MIEFCGSGCGCEGIHESTRADFLDSIDACKGCLWVVYKGANWFLKMLSLFAG